MTVVHEEVLTVQIGLEMLVNQPDCISIGFVVTSEVSNTLKYVNV